MGKSNVSISQVLSLPQYIHFEEVGRDDWRDPGETNPGLSISSNGWFNHASNERGSLQMLLKKIDIDRIYNNSTLDDSDINIIKDYFKSRDIDITESVINQLECKINRFKSEMSIVTPMRDVLGKIIQLHVIKLNQFYEKENKSRFLGSATKDRGIFLKKNANKLIITEGLENGIIIFQRTNDYDVLCIGPAVNFKRSKDFFNGYSEIIALLDNDLDDASLRFSIHLGHDVTRLMHHEKEKDANDAHEEGWFEQWFSDLRPVTYDEVLAAQRDKTAPLDWPDVGEKYKPLNTIENLKYLLDRLGVTAQYNVISKDTEISGLTQVYGPLDGGKNAAVHAIISEACKAGLPKENTDGYLDAIAYGNPYNPVLEMIHSKKWDGRDRLQSLYDTVTPIHTFSKELKELVIKKWLIGAVAMGCNDDANYFSKGVLVFQGDQNVGKTSWFWSLLPQKYKHLAKEGMMLNPSEKDSIIGAIRYWLVELGELEATFKKADIARIKAFITNKTDSIRVPYARREHVFPRRTMFFGSVNPDEFLRDSAGNIRFWTIPVRELKYKHGINMQQVWVQVYTMFERGENWHLDDGESILMERMNEERREAHPVELKILDFLSAYANADHGPMTTTEILSQIGYEKHGRGDLNAAASALRKYVGNYRKSNGRKIFDICRFNRDNLHYPHEYGHNSTS